MGRTFFVAGTDTEVGKTYTTGALLARAAQLGLDTAAVKPLASGCERSADGLRNADALLLQRAMTRELPYQSVNPVALEPAVAPHIAAREAGISLHPAQLAEHCREVMGCGAELVLIEGAGGWRLPLGDGAFLSDVPRALDIPVILVVGMRLGCINHALLSAEAIRGDGLELAGWVANCVQPEMARLRENLHTLEQLLPAPRLGTLPFDRAADYRQAAAYLDLEPLLG